MSAHKHTPGPWEQADAFGANPAGTAVKAASDNFLVASCTSYYGRDGAVANARLIAAAPELLEELNKLTSFVVTEVVDSCNGNKCRESWCAGCFGEEVAEQTVREAREAMDAARAAIAKATGEPA